MTNLNTASRADLEIAILDGDLEDTLFNGFDNIINMDTEEIRAKLISFVVNNNEANC